MQPTQKPNICAPAHTNNVNEVGQELKVWRAGHDYRIVGKFSGVNTWTTNILTTNEATIIICCCLCSAPYYPRGAWVATGYSSLAYMTC